LLLTIACSGRDKPASRDDDQPPAVSAPSAPSPVQEAPAPAADGAVSGTVTETMDAGGYTYALLDRGGTRVWVAGPQTPLTVGTVIGPTTGNLMTGFRSNTLNRSFDEIYFITAFPVAGGAPAAQPHGAPAPSPATVEKVTPAPGGLTVEKLYADRAKHANKPVVVRGKVTKVNSGIMGRTWVHLQDGTGGAGTNDLMVTTEGTAKVGDIVVVRGTLAVDKDFGAGYHYDVIVENATLAAK
ncbi:MAG TPA: OB-fold nucleic acid binding domain-containing protein, partial [Kofleriaceae bacterium]|nr:OB-fold nucleic acid binding domain-containing protein [Kofleriaceae bacterium]